MLSEDGLKVSVTTRFPPSPTGDLHIGGVRTALFNWLFARSQGGRFILRIEDTDKNRSTDEAIEGIIKGLDWLGLDFDEGPIFQTERLDRYAEVIEKLLEDGSAYRCYCTKERLDGLREAQIAKKEKPRYDGLCRDLDPTIIRTEQFVVRLKTPKEGKVGLSDIVQGDVVYDNSELDDMIIARGDGSPTYHLAAVVDDIDMGITHVIRGDDHLNNTPRQMHIYRALGEPYPHYAHIPMIHGQDGKKLSKRHGALSILEYQKAGFLAEAVINYLSRLGWSWGDKEIFELEELLTAFNLTDVNKAAAKFDIEKLNWVNHQHMIASSLDRLVTLVKPYLHSDPVTCDSRSMRVVELQRERAKNLVDLAKSSDYFFEAPQQYQPKHSKKFLTEMTRPILKQLQDELELLTDWQIALLDEIIEKVCQERGLGMGKVAQPLRVALTGSTSSPGIGETMFLIGRNEVLKRLAAAMKFIDNNHNET